MQPSASTEPEPEAVEEPAALSKHAQKKQAKLLLKKQMKAEHRANAHGVMLQEARRLRARLQREPEATVAHEALYAQLPRASVSELFADLPRDGDDAPAAAEGLSAEERACLAIGQFMWRAPRYNEKYASQELSLLYQLYRLGGDQCDLIIDIGAGNANLSCLIALVFDVPVVCVEMESPRAELRGETWLPEELKRRRAVTRVESLIQDYELPPGFERVLVLGKHLCGPGTDAGIAFVARHQPRVMGCVFATCCCCKLVGGVGALGAGTTLFADLYFRPRGTANEAGERVPTTGEPLALGDPSGAAVEEGGSVSSCSGRAESAAPACIECEPGKEPEDDAPALSASGEGATVGPTARPTVAQTARDEAQAQAARDEAPATTRATPSAREMARARDAARLMAAKEKAKAVGKQLCRRFLRYGECSDGAACTLYHCLEGPDDDDDDAHSLFRRYRFPRKDSEDGAPEWSDGSAVAAGAEGGGGGERGASFFSKVLPDVARATSWRNAVFNGKHEQTSAYAEVLDQAEYFESWIQGFRRRRLHALFGAEEELLYCSDDVHSQQNRCLVSGVRLRARAGGQLGASEPAAGERAAFFALLAKQHAKYAAVLPMDLRVRGLVSAKFDYDGSSLPWVEPPAVEAD